MCQNRQGVQLEIVAISHVPAGVFSDTRPGVDALAMSVPQMFLTCFPKIRLLLGTTRIGPARWVSMPGGGLAVYVVAGTEKWLRLRAGIKASE